MPEPTLEWYQNLKDRMAGVEDSTKKMATDLEGNTKQLGEVTKGLRDLSDKVSSLTGSITTSRQWATWTVPVLVSIIGLVLGGAWFKKACFWVTQRTFHVSVLWRVNKISHRAFTFG